MKKPGHSLADTALVQVPLTLVTYAFYASLIGISLIPSFYLVFFAIKQFLLPLPEVFSLSALVNILLFCLCLGGALYLYFISGILVMGSLYRLLSLGIKPGSYPMHSLVMLRWLIYSGIFMLVVKTILPLTMMTFFSNLFFKIIGCKIGRNVYINSPNLNDPYLLELGDNVVIGGLSNISCHTFEGNKLVLGRIKIGKNTLIGTNCYINPDVTIGERCVIGLYSFIRKGQTIPDRTQISALAGLPARRVSRIEKGLD